MTQQNRFKTLLKLYRSIMPAVKRRRTRNRVPRPVPYPIGLEKAYKRVVSTYTDLLISRTSSIVNRFSDMYFVRKDSVESDLDALMEQLEREIEFVYGVSMLSSGALGRALSEIAERILGANSAYMQKQIQVIAGTPITIDTPWWQTTKALWENQNYNLIKGLGTEYIGKINNIVINGLQSGQSIEEIADAISKVGDNISGARARLIARDQVGKLNSLISKSQMLEIGMETYFWSTSLDEKVRGNPSGIYRKSIPSHWIMQDLLMAWNNPEVYSDDLGKTWKKKTGKMEPGHVGMAYQCRCTAMPTWSQYVGEIDRVIEGGTP